MRIPRTERVFIYGPSGSGKTTLLGLVAGVLRAPRGMVEILGQDLGAMSGAACDAFRGDHLGYIFQMFNLIPYLSVLDNITLPCRLSAARRAKLDQASMEDAAREMANNLGLEGIEANTRSTSRPSPWTSTGPRDAGPDAPVTAAARTARVAPGGAVAARAVRRTWPRAAPLTAPPPLAQPALRPTRGHESRHA